MKKVYSNMAEPEKLSDVKKSEHLARTIELIKIQIHANGFDLEHARKMHNKFIEKAEIYDAAAVLNPGWNENGSKILFKQAKCLSSLMEFVKGITEVSALKKEVEVDAAVRKEYEKIFNL